jgi:hypothetical protein
MRLLAPGERIDGLRCPVCASERLRDEVAGCAMRIETWWELPRDALPARLRRSRSAWRAPLALVALWSGLTRPLNFGSMAAVRFDRVATAAE